METVTKMAWDPDTEREYEVKLPTESIVEMVLLKVDYPPGGLHRSKIVEILAEQFSLTDEQKNAKYKSPNRVFNSHVGKVIGALIKSGKMVKTKSGWRDINREQVDEQGKTIENNFDNSEGAPEESIEGSYQQIRKGLAAELLQKISENTPAFFEKLVVDLLVKMGYSGSREDAGKAVGRSGDGGIDGIINEDRLGLDAIYIQAKRWGEGSVGSPDIDKFSGALNRKGASKGVFITTSRFTDSAKNAVKENAGLKIVLIDGHQLAQLMIDHDVGVSIEKTYEIKRVDSDYFAENTENS
jgi:restriction endonuclease Mrr